MMMSVGRMVDWSEVIFPEADMCFLYSAVRNAPRIIARSENEDGFYVLRSRFVTLPLELQSGDFPVVELFSDGTVPSRL
jgi:hypothetical protein